MKTFWLCEKCQQVGSVEHDEHAGVFHAQDNTYTKNISHVYDLLGRTLNKASSTDVPFAE